MKTRRLYCLHKHFKRSAIGYLGRHVSLLRLIKERLRFTITRQIQPINSPEGWPILNVQMLVSYWDLFIERNLDGPWLDGVKTAIDVGANYGLFTRLLWNRSPTAGVLAFEPMRDLCERLNCMWRQPASFYCLPIALTDRNGIGVLNLSEEGTTGSLTDYVNTGKQVKVELGKLDDHTQTIRCVDLLKVDIDGNEQAFLSGAQETLKKVKWLLIEYKDGPISDLQLNGFGKPTKISHHDYAFRKNEY